MITQPETGAGEPLILLIDGSGLGACLLILFTLLLIERLISCGRTACGLHEISRIREARNDR